MTNTTLVEVIETNKVTYSRKSFLFFDWYTKVSTEKMRNDIYILTNDTIDGIYLNDKKFIINT